MDLEFDKDAYVKSFEERLATFENHPLNYYKPSKFKFAGLGG